MKKIEQENHQTEQVLSPEGEKDKYLQFGKFTRDCPQWILDKVAKIDNSEINQRYVEEVLRAIVDEFDSKKTPNNLH